MCEEEEGEGDESEWRVRVKNFFKNFFKLETVMDFYHETVRRTYACKEGMNDCECSFEIDEEDCPTQPGELIFLQLQLQLQLELFYPH